MGALFKKHKGIFFQVGLVLLAALILVVGNRVTTKGEIIFSRLSAQQVERAKVVEVLYPDYKENGGSIEKQIVFKAKVLSGPERGEILRTLQIQVANYVVPIKDVEVGDSIMITHAPYQGQSTWMFLEYNRGLPLLVLFILFFALLIIFGGKKGLSTMISLILTCSCVFFFFVPAILTGTNIYYATLFTCTYIVAVTLLLVNGPNYKSLAAAVGCFGGLMISGILFFVMDYFLVLTGMVDEESAYLTMLDTPIDLKGIIFSAVLIGVLGGVLDVGVSIAASLGEIYPEGKEHQMKDIFASGMNIGRDILCTMTNTLILVYIGSALSLTLLLALYSNSALELINRETVTVEILAALLGSIGLLFTIPLTTLFYGLGATTFSPPPSPDLVEAVPLPLRVEPLPTGLQEKMKTDTADQIKELKDYSQTT